jgi:hypothetical protein
MASMCDEFDDSDDMEVSFGKTEPAAESVIVIVFGWLVLFPIFVSKLNVDTIASTMHIVGFFVQNVGRQRKHEYQQHNGYPMVGAVVNVRHIIYSSL